MNETQIREWITTYISEYLDIPAEKITNDTDFNEMGIDSLEMVLVAGAFEDRFNVAIDAGVFLRNDTIDALINDFRDSGLVQ